MVACRDCEQEMTTAEGCTADAVRLRGEIFPRSRYTYARPGRRCGDCGARRGRFHHLGCDVERCPKCHQQLIGCGCSWSRSWEDEDAESDPVSDLAPVWTGRAEKRQTSDRVSVRLEPDLRDDPASDP